MQAKASGTEYRDPIVELKLQWLAGGGFHVRP